MKTYKESIKESISDTLIFLGILVVVQLIWEGLEMLFLGHTNPNIIDTIIGTILVFSLHSNYKNWLNKRN